MKDRFVNKRMLLVINRMCVRLTGGTAAQHNVRGGADLGFVDYVYHNEVFGQPIYPDLFHQAAAYLFFVVKNHIFLDGNKRTGLAAAITFLQWNGIHFAPLDEDHVFDFVMKIAAGPNDPDATIPEVALWLASMCEPSP